MQADIFGEEVDSPYVYLFNDLLLVCRNDAAKKKGGKMVLLHRVPLGSQDTEVQELPWGFTQPTGFAVHQEARGRVELVFPEGDAKAAEWRDALTKALELLKEAWARRGADTEVEEQHLALTPEVSG